MLSRQRKKEIVENLSDEVEKTNSVFFVDFAGLSTHELNDLKNGLRENEGQMKVVKKSLLPLVSEKSKIEFDFKNHKGSVAFVYAKDEGVEAAKSVANFSKDHEKLVILGGLFQKSFIGPEKIKELATLPSKEELIGKLMYLLNPAGSLVRVLASPASGFINVINSIKDKK